MHEPCDFLDTSLAQLSSTKNSELFRDTLFSFVFSHALIGHQHSKLTRFSLGAIIWITVIVFPLVLLTWAQIRFIPFHAPTITGIHRIAVLLDVIALWSIWPLIMDTNNKALHWWCTDLISPYRRTRQLSTTLRIAFRLLWRPRPNSCVLKRRWQQYNRCQRRFTPPSPHAQGFVLVIMVSVVGLLFSFVAVIPDERMESWVAQRIPRAWQHAESRPHQGWWLVEGEERKVSYFKLTYRLFNNPGKPFQQNLALAEAVLIAETPEPRIFEVIPSWITLDKMPT